MIVIATNPTPPTAKPPGHVRQAVSERRAAGILGIAPQTLMRWRQDNEAPPNFVVPRPSRNLVRYPLAGLDEWKKNHGLK